MSSHVMMELGSEPVSPSREGLKKPAFSKSTFKSLLRAMTSKRNICALTAILLALLIVSFAIAVKDSPRVQEQNYIQVE